MRHHQPAGTRRRVLLLLALATLAGAGPMLACYGPEYRSVRFHGLRPDFFQMPQPWRGVPSEERALPTPSGYAIDLEGNPPVLMEPAQRRAEESIRRALRQEAAGHFREAAAAWEQYRREKAAVDPWTVTEEWWEPRQPQALDDRLVALRAWRGPRDTPDLRAYLRARDLVNAGKYARAEPLLAGLRRAPFRTRADYLRASIRFHIGPPEAAVVAARGYLERHPRDPFAHYLLARSCFRAIRIDEKAERRRLQPERRRQLLRQAQASYQACVAASPNGPLAADARGKVAACAFRLGDRVQALTYYCGQLAALPPGRDNHFAFLSARACLRRMGLAEHREFQARSVSRPDLAAVYLDLHLHFSRPGLRACENLGRFALAVLAREPSAPLSRRLLTRLAVVEGRLGHWERTERLATAAIRRCAPGGYRDQARWQRAQALRQLRRRGEALAEYERLASSAVVPNLRRGAREAAAILAEEGGDRPNALRHYFALEYRADYAYLIDSVMSQQELREFFRRYPDHPQVRLVRYSLGFRQLRVGQYEAAAQTFASLGPWLDVAEKKYDCQKFDEIPRWPPLKLARFLAAASHREATAHTAAEKARAAYSRGQILYHQRYEALYNGALWEGTRIGTVDIDGPGSEISGLPRLDAGEQRILDRYQREHAPLYQALLIFERIARQYPRTPEAPKALLSAGRCYDLLGNMDRYWRGQKDLEAKAIRLYHRLQREYPDDPLVPAAIMHGGRIPRAERRAGAAGQRRGS